MYLKKISLDKIRRCMADKSKIRVKGTFSDQIGELLPYLNRVFDNTVYSHQGPKLEIVFEEQGYKIILSSTEVRVDRLSNSSQGRQVLDWLKEQINEVYENKDQIEPDHKSLSNLKVPDIYKFLPKLNCEKCGQKTCFAFATLYVRGDYELEDCSPLFEEEYQELKVELEEYLNKALYAEN